MLKKSFLISLTMLLVLFGTKGQSDLYPNEVFQGLQSLLKATQIEFDYEVLEENADEILAKNLTLTITDADFVVEFPTLHLVKQGTNLVEILLPDNFVILGSTGNELPFEFAQGTFNGTKRIIFEQGEEGTKIDYSIEEAEISSQDESIALLVLLKNILGKVQFEDITQIDVEGFTSTSSIEEVTGRFQSRDSIGFAFKGTNFTSNSINRGLSTSNNLGIDLPLGDYNSSVETSQFILELGSDSTLGLLINQLGSQMNISEDGLEMNIDTQDIVIAYEGFIQEAVAISNTDFDLSLDWKDVGEKYHLANDISLNKIQWKSAHMEQIDPEQEFAEEAASIQISYKLTGNKAFFDFENTDFYNLEDFDFTLLSNWKIWVFDLFSKGSGEYQYDRGKSSAESEVIVEGAENLLERLISANMVSPDLAPTILGYMRLLDPTSTSGNSFMYKVVMDEDFEVTVNGINLGNF